MTDRAGDARLLPLVDDCDTGGYFDAAKRHELVVCVCNACHAVLHLPRGYCAKCGGSEIGWREVPGQGSIYSWTTIEQQVHPGYPVPYTVIVVQLDEPRGVRLVGFLPGAPELAAGRRVQVRWEEAGGDVVLPQWQLL
jgi:uncharacterized protein